MFIKIIILVSTLFSLSLNAKNIDNQTFNKIDNHIKKVQNEVNIPSISIGIVKDDKLVYKKSYSEDKNINENSLYYIGSLTKSFTALAILQLIEEKKLNLDDSIKKHLPWFKIKDMENIDKITIRTLLNQTSGFSTFEGLKNFDDWDSSDFALEKTIMALKDISLKSEPSKTFQYSNINYQILGLIIEKVSGVSYDQYINKNIFQKLSMNNSFASLDNLDKNNLVQAHIHWFGHPIKSDYPFSKIMLPAGYIVSNIEDMSKYLINQINIEVSKNIKQIQTQSAPIVKDSLYYGFGWFTHTKDELSLDHLGSTPGYTSTMIIYPQDKLGIILLSNTTSYTLGNSRLTSLASDIIDIIKNKEPKDKAIDIISIIAYIFFIIAIIIKLFFIYRFIKKPKNISKFKITISIIFDILIILSLYILLPKLYNLTFGVFLMFSPDIGYLMLGLIMISIFGIIGKIFYFLRSNKNKAIL